MNTWLKSNSLKKMINHFRFFYFENFRFLISLMGISLVWIHSNIPNAWWKYHNSIFHFFFFFRNPNCGDNDLIYCNNVNCLDGFFWIRDVSCGIPVKGQSFNQVWICSGLFGLKGFRFPQWKEKMWVKLDWHGAMENLAFG